MVRTIRRAGCGLLIALCCCQCGRDPEPGETAVTLPEDAPATATNAEPILPIPAPPNVAPEKLELGKQLFHETALSGASRKVSCATCHDLEKGGTTGKPPAGTGAAESEPYDIPTVFNAAHQFAHFWNGRAQSLEAVIQASIRAENIMDGSWDAIIPALSENPDYVARFERIYPEAGLSESSVEDALTSYVRSLSTPNSAFDRWLAGEELAADAREGYELFKELGCVRCHQGAGVGGNLFASFGSYLAARERVSNSDLGRFNVTNNESHRYQFKVPGLRNVVLTAPYFHDGSVAKLEDAVRAMAQHQLGQSLSDEEVRSLVSFLETLTGSALLGATGGTQP
jgi:cytochrome c peroxidase